MTHIDGRPSETTLTDNPSLEKNKRVAPASPLDINALRHPTEASRFALALVASTVAVSIAVYVLVSLGRAAEVLLLLLSLAAMFVLLWLLLQLWRVRLLADSVKVTRETLPEVQDAVDTVRQRLDYYGRVDLFVTDKISRVLSAEAPPITLTSYFGVRVIVAEGAALGDPSSEQERSHLLFLLATHFGAIKARHTQWSPFLIALQISGLPKLVSLFIYPWYRATIYTGDRIAYACCGDLGVGVQAVYRAMAGKEAAPHLRASGLVDQALSVRRNMVLRLSQLLRPVPHATNRYLDLLSFAADREPAAFQTFRAALGPARDEADSVFARMRRRRPLILAPAVGLVLSALLLGGGVAAGLGVQGSNLPPITPPVSGAPGPTVPTEEPSVVETSSPFTSDNWTPEPEPATSAETLASIIAENGPLVDNLVGYWVPQLSSKRIGLEADGIVYDHDAILASHSALKGRYPEALLLWSGDYATFKADDFYVTITPVPFEAGDDANAWCETEDIPPDDCFAKRIDHTGGPQGATLPRG